MFHVPAHKNTQHPAGQLVNDPLLYRLEAQERAMEAQRPFAERRSAYNDNARAIQSWLSGGARVLALAPIFHRPATSQQISERLDDSLMAIDAPDYIPAGAGFIFITR